MDPSIIIYKLLGGYKVTPVMGGEVDPDESAATRDASDIRDFISTFHPI